MIYFTSTGKFLKNLIVSTGYKPNIQIIGNIYYFGNIDLDRLNQIALKIVSNHGNEFDDVDIAMFALGEYLARMVLDGVGIPYLLHCFPSFTSELPRPAYAEVGASYPETCEAVEDLRPLLPRLTV